MSKYSEFVKAYMAKHKMNWACAVCEIKKGNLYKKGKIKDTSRRKNFDTPNKNEEEESDPEMDMPLDELVAKDLTSANKRAKDLTSADKRVLPAPPVRIPHLGTLGSLPIELGMMIQDFIRPTEEMLTERRRKIEKDILDYANGEAKKYRKFKAIKISVFELHPRFTTGWSYGETGDAGGLLPDYLEYVKSELDRYDAVFKKHFLEIEERLHTEIPASVLEPSTRDMRLPYDDIRYRKGRKAEPVMQDIIKRFRKWLEKSVREAQLLKRSIKKIPRDLESKVDSILEEEEEE
jgi:hypothetical protein